MQINTLNSSSIPDTRHHGNGTARLTGEAALASSPPPEVHSTTNLLPSKTPHTLSPPIESESQLSTTAGLPTLRLSVRPRTDAETLTHDLATDSSETPDQLHPLPDPSTVIVDRPDNSQPDSNRQPVDRRQSR